MATSAEVIRLRIRTAEGDIVRWDSCDVGTFSPALVSMVRILIETYSSRLKKYRTSIACEHGDTRYTNQ